MVGELQMVYDISERFSFRGWDIKKWISGNANSIKIIVGAVVALSVANPELIPFSLTAGAGAIVVKALLDIVNYWSVEVDNSE